MRASTLVGVVGAISGVASLACLGTPLPACLVIVSGDCCTALDYDGMTSIKPGSTLCEAGQTCIDLIVTNPTGFQVPAPAAAGQNGWVGAQVNLYADPALCAWYTAFCNGAGCQYASGLTQNPCRSWKVPAGTPTCKG